MTTRVFYASTLFGAMSIAAAIDAGLFGERAERRLLLVSTNARIPEITTRFDESPGFDPLRQRFDDIICWNDVIAPLHPADWVPPASEVPLLSRLVRRELGLDDGVRELVVESLAVAPARSIATLIRECPITVYSDGLMSYGPTRSDLTADVGRRTQRLLYLDLVPSVRPLLLRENEVDAQPIPDSVFAKVLAELPRPAVDGDAGLPVVVGQYLGALDLLTADEEAEVHIGMLGALAAAGHRHVVFRPHPAAGRGQVRRLRAGAAALGVQLSVADDGLPAEAWFAAARPELVVSCFSTALLTAGHYFGIPVASTGTGLVLERITPYQNSNRIPATIVDAMIPRLGPDGTIADPPDADVAALVAAVGFCMQSTRNPDLRDAAAAYVQEHGPQRYFKKRRLERLGLLVPPVHRSAPVVRAARAGRRALARLRTAVG